MRRLSLLISLCYLCFSTLAQNDRTVGLFTFQEGTFDAYTLFNPLNTTDTYLIDNCGRLINTWTGPYTPGNSTYLLEDGTLMRTAKTDLISNPFFVFGGAGDRVQILNWNSEVLWDFEYSDSIARMHHDIEPMPNGNVLILAWERFTAAEAIAMGRDSNLLPDGELWGEHIIEVVPFTNEIVWEWYFKDHWIQEFDSTKANYGLIADHPELMNLNYMAGSSSNGSKDWMHMNSIDYNEALDQILIHTPYLGEIYIIDHSTTTEEAAGHIGGRSGKGGDLLYRWGNPEAYNSGVAEDRKLYAAHDARWIEPGLPDEGKIMLFNNGSGRPEGLYSSIDMIQTPVPDPNTGNYPLENGMAYLPDTLYWSYTAEEPTDFFSIFLSGAQRLANGNTLICDGAFGRFFEINAADSIVWEYVNPAVPFGLLEYNEEIPLQFNRNANVVFRCTKYPVDYIGFENQDLSPGEVLELNPPLEENCPLVSDLSEPIQSNLKVFPNPAQSSIHIISEVYLNTNLRLINIQGQAVWHGQINGSQLTIELPNIPAGIYYLKSDQGLLQQLVVKM